MPDSEKSGAKAGENKAIKEWRKIVFEKANNACKLDPFQTDTDQKQECG